MGKHHRVYHVRKHCISAMSPYSHPVSISHNLIYSSLHIQSLQAVTFLETLYRGYSVIEHPIIKYKSTKQKIYKPQNPNQNHMSTSGTVKLHTSVNLAIQGFPIVSSFDCQYYGYSRGRTWTPSPPRKPQTPIRMQPRLSHSLASEDLWICEHQYADPGL